jgi:hypothetical protein
MTSRAQDQRIADLYRATTTPRLVQVPPLTFLCLDGHGDPNTSASYAAVIQALYSMSYAAKFAVKKAGGPDFRVAPLEGLWWAEDLRTFQTGAKEGWSWTMMIRQPPAVTAELCARLATELAQKRPIAIAQSPGLTTFEEGPAAQVMHVGPYATEGPTIARLHDFIRDQGFTFDGLRHKHHEIYLGDPRRAAPERLRTIIRQPYAAHLGQAGGIRG